MTTAASVSQKIWNYCNVLRDAGLSYGDYLEQLTYLIFLKMMHERNQPPYTWDPNYVPPPIPEGYDWATWWLETATIWNAITGKHWKCWAASRERWGSSSPRRRTGSRSRPCSPGWCRS